MRQISLCEVLEWFEFSIRRLMLFWVNDRFESGWVVVKVSEENRIVDFIRVSHFFKLIQFWALCYWGFKDSFLNAVSLNFMNKRFLRCLDWWNNFMLRSLNLRCILFEKSVEGLSAWGHQCLGFVSWQVLRVKSPEFVWLLRIFQGLRMSSSGLFLFRDVSLGVELELEFFLFLLLRLDSVEIFSFVE